jgi:hypothetical protein
MFIWESFSNLSIYKSNIGVVKCDSKNCTFDYCICFSSQLYFSIAWLTGVGGIAPLLLTIGDIGKDFIFYF